MRTRSMILLCSLAVVACTKSTPASTSPDAATTAGASEADPLAGKPVVENTQAQTGDVTVCPYSGRKFIVKADSPRWEYEGKTWVLCSSKALAEVQKDPTKYLGATPPSHP